MKKGEVYTLAFVLGNIANIKDGVKAKFSYGIMKNRGTVKNEVDAINEARKILGDYNEEHKVLCEKYADKDAKGKTIIQNGVYKGIDLTPTSEFSKEFAVIKEKYNKEIKQIDDLMAEEVKIEFHKILITDFPDGISAVEMEALMPIINDEEKKA